MRLPNKVTPYGKSILPKLPIILNELVKGDLTPKKLFDKTKKKFSSVDEFIEAMDCLYLLNKVRMNREELLHYVKND